ncbi:hypothetical protein O5550_14145 [Escherichia coli]|nr:hypothetical protein [Escherichia coli]
MHSVQPPRTEHCYICWRPEDAQYVSQPQAGNNHFSLTLDKMAFMGNLTEAWGHNDSGLSVRLQLIKKPPVAHRARVPASVWRKTPSIFWSRYHEKLAQ